MSWATYGGYANIKAGRGTAMWLGRDQRGANWAHLVVDGLRPRDLRRTTTGPLVGDDPAAREQLTAPDAPGLFTLEGASEALRLQGAEGAHCLRSGDINDMVGEEEADHRAVAVSTPGFRGANNVGFMARPVK